MRFPPLTSLASVVETAGDFSLTLPVTLPGRPARTSDGAVAPWCRGPVAGCRIKAAVDLELDAVGPG
jgi:hypothetical protein